MSRWQEFGFPDHLKFTSPIKAMRGITLAVEERLRQAYPAYAEGWYAGNNYKTPFNFRTYAPVYQIEYGYERNYLNQGSIFPQRFPNSRLLNPLGTLPKIDCANPSRIIHGFWDYSKESSGEKILTEEEYSATLRVDQYGRSYCTAEERCRFNDAEDELPEEFRFQYAFSERYFLHLYEKINPLKSYLSFRVREQSDGSFLYCFSAEPIQNLTFSD